MNIAIVSTALPGIDKALMELEVSELQLLCSNLGYDVKKKIHQNINQINPSTFIGKGKIDEIDRIAGSVGIKLIVLNDEISPGQMKNIQKKLAIYSFIKCQKKLKIYYHLSIGILRLTKLT